MAFPLSKLVGIIGRFHRKPPRRDANQTRYPYKGAAHGYRQRGEEWEVLAADGVAVLKGKTEDDAKQIALAMSRNTDAVLRAFAAMEANRTSIINHVRNTAAYGQEVTR